MLALLGTMDKNVIYNLDDKINFLNRLLGPSCISEPPSAIFICGDSGVGKSLLIQHCLATEKYVCAIVNCVESYAMKNIYEEILNQLSSHKMVAEQSYRNYAKCSNVLDFVLNLQTLSEDSNLGTSEGRSIIIVLDKCEALRNINKNTIPALLKIRQLTELKICILYVSTLPWNNFYTGEYITQPITIFLEHYDQKQLLKILSNTRPDGIPTQFYDNFISLFLNVFYNACHDVRELKYQAKLNFTHYYEPVAKGELLEKDAGLLWKKSQGFFKKSLRSLYLKVDCNMELSDAENITSATTQALIMELPYYSKYILISSYIASYNPAAEDRRLFMKNSGKQKKSKKAKVNRVKHHLVGPKQFGLQRLFAILYAILNYDNFTANSDLFVEVGNLVKMKLLTQISDDVLDAPTYKCNVSLQFADVISRNVQFPLRKYLVDFMDS